MNDKLARALSGSQLVEYDEETGLVYAWNGSLTVNIYDTEGSPLDVFTFGLADGRDADVYYAERQIHDRMAVDRGEVRECIECGNLFDTTDDNAACNECTD